MSMIRFSILSVHFDSRALHIAYIMLINGINLTCIMPLLPNLFFMHQMNADMSDPQYQNSDSENDILPIDS